MTPSSFHQNGYWMASELYVPLAGLISEIWRSRLPRWQQRHSPRFIVIFRLVGLIAVLVLGLTYQDGGFHLLIRILLVDLTGRERRRYYVV